MRAFPAMVMIFLDVVPFHVKIVKSSHDPIGRNASWLMMVDENLLSTFE